MYFYALFKRTQVYFIRRLTTDMYKGVTSVTILGFLSSRTIAGIPLGPAFLGVSRFVGFNLYRTTHQFGCVHLNSHGTKAPPRVRCSHLNAYYTHVEA